MDDNILDWVKVVFKKSFHLFQIRKNSLHFYRRYFQFSLLEAGHRRVLQSARELPCSRFQEKCLKIKLSFYCKEHLGPDLKF